AASGHHSHAPTMGLGPLPGGNTTGIPATHITGPGNHAPTTILFSSTAVDPSEVNTAMVASQDNGIARFNGNLNWSYSSINVPSTGDGYHVKYAPSNDQIVYANWYLDYQNVVGFSTDGGQTFNAYGSISDPPATD